MTKIIDLPDGTEGEFPDEMSDADIATILRKKFPAKTVQLAEDVPESITNEPQKVQDYKEPPSASQRIKPEKLSYVEEKLANLPNWLLSGNRQMRSIAQGAADPMVGSAQLASNVIGAGDAMNKYLSEKEKEYQAQRGNSKNIDWLRGAGNVVSPANLLIASKLPAVAGLGARVLQGAGLGATSGAMAPVALGEDEDYWKNKALQVGIGTMLGGAFPVLGAGISRVIAPKGTPDVNLLNAEKIRTTVGQTLGGTAKALEDKLTSIPLVGDAINAARKGGIDDMNLAVYNRVLSNIGEKFPKAVEIGHDALKYIHDKASSAYENVFNKGMLEANPEIGPSYVDRLAGIRNMVAELPKEYQSAYDRAMKGFFDRAEKNTGNIGGEALTDAMRHLRTQIEKLNNKNDGFFPDVRNALKEANSTILDTLEKQNPKMAESLSAARNAWHDYAILRDAAASPGARADGVITPNQLLNSVASTAKKLSGQAAGKGQISEGTARMQDLAAAAQRVLPSKYPDSGTAGRLATMGIGATGLGAVFAPKALAAGALAAAPYLPGGRQVVNALISPARSQYTAPIAGALTQTAPLLGAVAPRLIETE